MSIVLEIDYNYNNYYNFALCIIPKYIIRLILDSYTRQTSCALWNNVKSRYFTMSNGVKQGGVISPIFFSLYIDPLLEYLRISGYGCHMKGVYIGALSYADDITILSPSIRGLNGMLKIYHIFAEKNRFYITVKRQCVLNLEVMLLEMKKHI